MNQRNVRYLPALALAGAVLAMGLSSGGCSAVQDVQNAEKGCDGLASAKGQADLSVKAWGDTIKAMQTAADHVQSEWLAVCNNLNTALSLDTSKTTAADACAVLNARIKTALDAGVTLTLDVSPPSCQADLSVQASCEASCQATANCDVSAHCTGGEVVVGCMGSCSGGCDVKAPDIACMGECKGSCTADVAVSCMGECTGSCDAPMWTGTCDAGCTANFSGTCGGNCTGMCKTSAGTMQMNGAACMGTCTGTCDAKASGSCMAACTGMFSGGTCSGMCKGSCNVAAGAMCMGKCDGTCTVSPGSASCNGECHGSCTGMATAPTCTGKLDCMASASCHGNCQAQAQAKLDCSPPQVTFAIEGDAALYAAFQANIEAIGQAFSDTLALKDLIGPVVGQGEATFSAIGSVSTAGAACILSEVQASANVSASVQVSVSASATVSGHS